MFLGVQIACLIVYTALSVFKQSVGIGTEREEAGSSAHLSKKIPINTDNSVVKMIF